MAFEILLAETVKAPREAVWNVITRLEEYPQWNPFVVACESTLGVNAPIIMQVRLLPSLTIRQKETVFAHRPGEYLEYGVRIPLLLNSSRQHIVQASEEGGTRYQSVFRLQGLLAPVVKALLGAHLQRGFRDMTRELVARSEASSNRMP